VHAEQVPLKDRFQTARKMHALVERYYRDLDFVELNGQSVGELALEKFFDLVKNIEYQLDPEPLEVVARPYYIFKYRSHGMDCKKKSILIGAWCRMNNIQYRFMGSSNRPDGDIHHVFPMAKIGGRWRVVDATYPENRLFEPKKNVTALEVLI
jgi:hypothetical protein